MEFIPSDTEHDEQNTYRQTEDVDRFVPWHVFKREGLATGREVLQLEKEFQDMVDDPTVECIHRRGQWLVPFYEGVRPSPGHCGVRRAPPLAPQLWHHPAQPVHRDLQTHTDQPGVREQHLGPGPGE